VIDEVLSNKDQYKGRIKQEDFALECILQNRLAEYLNA